MGIEAPYRRPSVRRKHLEHPVYPHLLRDRLIERLNEVWAMYSTYIPMKRGFASLAAVIDWASPDYTDVPKASEVAISMDGKNWRDNVFVGQFRTSMKHEARRS